MARHSKNSSFVKASIGAGSVAAVAAVPLMAMQAPAWAVDCDSYAAGIVGTDYLTVNDLGNGVCEYVFANESAADNFGEWVDFSNFQIPDGVQKLGILAVTPGSEVDHYGGYSAGGGGAVAYTELSADEGDFPDTLEGYAAGVEYYGTDLGSYPEGETWWGSTQSYSEVTANDDEYTVLYSRMNYDGNSYQYQIDATSGSDFDFEVDSTRSRACTWDPDDENIDYDAAAGVAEDISGEPVELVADADCLGGAGISPAELVDLGYADADLWAVDADTEYGAGGSILWEDITDVGVYQAKPFGQGADLYVGTQGAPIGSPAWADENESGAFPMGKNPGTGAIIIRMLFNDGPATYSGAQVYDGPSGLYTEKSVPVRSTGKATGTKLDTVSEILIGGNRVEFELQPDGSIVFETPDVDPGRYTITYVIAPGNVRLGDVINLVENNSSTPVSTGASYLRSKVFANYRGDSGVVLPADRAAISAFLSQYSNITHVTCVGSTSGVPAAPTDQALANSRAANACGVAESLVPNATIREVGVTGRGVGQAFRSVTIYVRGLK